MEEGDYDSYTGSDLSEVSGRRESEKFFVLFFEL
jgi:hypothetical protein